MLSPTYEITTALSHTDELISPPYDISIVTISYGRVIMSSVWDSMMSKKNVGWPFYAAVISWVLSSHLWILYHHVSPLQCHFQKFAGVVMKCTLHCHSILTTPLPLRSGNAVLICIFATHSNATPASHSNATPKPLLKYTSMPLRSAHSIATPLLPLQCHSHRTLQCHSGVSLEC